MDYERQSDATEALSQSESLHRGIFQNAAAGVDVVDRDGRFIQVNSTLCDILGYSEEELLKLTIFDVSHPDDAELSAIKHQEMLSHLTDSYKLVKRYVRKDGRIVWAEVSVSAVYGSDGAYLATVGVISDVTQRTEMEEALRESNHRYLELFEKARGQEELYLSMFNYSPDPIVVYDLDGNVRYLNPAHTRLFGWTLEEILGKRMETVPDWDRENSMSIIEDVLSNTKTNRSYETQRLTKDKRTIDVSISGSLYLDHSGAPAGMIVIIHNISERKKAQEVQRRLATAIEQAAETVVITDSSAIIQYVNPAFEKTTGYSKAEAIGQNPHILKSGHQDAQFYDKLWQTVTKGEVWSGRLVNRKKDGSIYYEDATISPVKDEKGNICNYVAVKRDVTETVELTRQLLHSQKMEAIGTLAGGIAHDFNNILQVVMGYCEILMENKKYDQKELRDLQKIFTAGKKGAGLVEKLLTFSRNEQARLEPTDLNAEITQIRDILFRTITRSIKINLNLSHDLSLVNADSNQIAQVVMNLALNARDAMDDGGTLTVETRNVFLDEDYCSRHLDVNPGKYALLIVSDTGAGMDESTIDHIFEPFFSTKEVGKGTGLGLATVYGIVKHHGGHLTCESQPGKGSSFQIYFPAIES